MLNKKVKKLDIFLDSADINELKKYKNNKFIKGFTTNPSLMRKAGVKNYELFCRKILKLIKNKPISFEVFADEYKAMKYQSLKISKFAKNVYVKIPIINTKNHFNTKLIGELNKVGVCINVTAVFTIKQTREILKKIGKKTPIIISVFCGRLADAGVDPKIEILKHIKITKKFSNVKILWASVRQPYNIIEAEKTKCHIITVPPEILKKTKSFDKNLNEFSVETVKNFYLDAKKSKFKIA